jgi:hypothetical protein
LPRPYTRKHRLIRVSLVPCLQVGKRPVEWVRIRAPDRYPAKGAEATATLGNGLVAAALQGVPRVPDVRLVPERAVPLLKRDEERCHCLPADDERDGQDLEHHVQDHGVVDQSVILRAGADDSRDGVRK